MNSHFDRLVAIKDLGELNRALQLLECCCQDLAKAIDSARPALDDGFQNALVVYLKAYRAHWLAPAKEFAACMAATAKWQQAPDLRVRYLSCRAFCLRARRAWRTGDLDQAQKCLDDAHALALSIGFGYLRAECLVLHSLIETASSEWDRAADLAREALTLATEDGGDELGQAAAWEALGRAHFEKGDFQQAYRDLETSLAFRKRCLDDYGQVETQLLRAHLCYHTGHPRRYQRFLAEADTLSKSLDYSRGLGTVRRYQGKLLLQQGDWKGAVERFKESLAFFDATGDPAGCARTHLSLARGYAAGCQWDVARTEYDLAEKTFGKAKDSVRQATCQITKALLVAHQAEKDPNAPANANREAKTLFRRAEASFRRRGDRRHLASALFEIGEQYSRWKDYGAAAEYLKEAIRCASDMQAERLVECYQSEERLAVSSGEWAKALLDAKREREKAGLVLESVSHDLGNMVQSVSGFAFEAFSQTPSFCPVRDSLQKVTNKGKYLNSVCRGMCDSAKARGGKLSLDRREVQLVRCVSQALGIVSPLTHAKTVQIVSTVTDEIRVLADEGHLTRILVNLIGNADKYTFEGAITVAAKESERKVTVTVEDTGKGIARAKQKKVFDLFWQATDYRERQAGAGAPSTGGFGIGLAYCKLAVESHGGRIWVDRDETCQEGEDSGAPDRHGTVIRFTLLRAPHPRVLGPDRICCGARASHPKMISW